MRPENEDLGRYDAVCKEDLIPPLENVQACRHSQCRHEAVLVLGCRHNATWEIIGYSEIKDNRGQNK